jgi:hypothetical protein
VAVEAVPLFITDKRDGHKPTRENDTMVCAPSLYGLFLSFFPLSGMAQNPERSFLFSSLTTGLMQPAAGMTKYDQEGPIVRLFPLSHPVVAVGVLRTLSLSLLSLFGVVCQALRSLYPL